MASEMTMASTQKFVVHENQTESSNICQNNNIINTNGDRTNQVTAAQIEGMTLVCHVCNKHFDTKEILNKHILSHTAIISQIFDALGDSSPVKDLTGLCTDFISSRRAKNGFAEKTNKKDSSMINGAFVEAATAQDKEGNIRVKENLAEDINVEYKSNETNYHNKLIKETQRKAASNVQNKCFICAKSFAKKGGLEVHMMIHNGVKPHACSKCNRKFTQKSTLKRHLNSCGTKNQVVIQPGSTVHNEQRQLLMGDSEDVSTCFKEGNVTDYEYDTELISKTAMPQKDSNCVADGPIHSTNVQYVAKTLKSFVCTACGYKCPSASNLKIHWRIHTGERPYSCHICHKSFRQSNNRNRHVRNVHKTDHFEEAHSKSEFYNESDKVSVSNMDSVVMAEIVGEMLYNKAPTTSTSEMNPIFLDTNEQDMNPLEEIETCFDDRIDSREKTEDLTKVAAGRLYFKTAADDIINNNDNESLSLTAQHQNENGYEETYIPVSSMPFDEISNIVKLEPVKIKSEQNNDTSKFSTQSLFHTDKRDSEHNMWPTNVVPCTSDHAKLATVLLGDGQRKKTYVCNVCGLATRNKVNFKYHLFSHTREKPFDCLLCKRAFRRQWQLERHIRFVHVENKTKENKKKEFKCNFCSKLFARQGKLERHLMIHTGEKPDPCPICNKFFRGPGDLKVHMKRHDKSYVPENKSLVCELCGKLLKTLGGLQMHMLIHSGVGKDWICEICGKSFKWQACLYKHQKIHFGIRDNICDFCNKSFTNKTDLTSHISDLHFDIRNFQCSVCNKSFHTKKNLNQHMHCHSTERPLVCPTCGKSFGRKEVFKSHLFSHTGVKPFSCDLCGQKFTRKRNLKIHMLIHEGKKPHRCETCGNNFRQKIELKLHIRRHHANTSI